MQKCSSCQNSSVVSENGVLICTDCGQLLARDLQTTSIPYGYFPLRVRETYTRERRFMKILRNLQGYANVKTPTLLGVKIFLENSKLALTPQNIIFALKKLPKNLRNGQIYHQISSVFRALSEKSIPQLSFQQMKTLRHAFRELESRCKHTHSTLSFSYLVPALLHHLGIFQYDTFIKPIKSSIVMARNEAIWNKIKAYLLKFRNVVHSPRGLACAENGPPESESTHATAL